MAKAARRGPGDKIGDWRIEEALGGGGNGTVWRVSRPGSPDRALKTLRRLSNTALARFKAEIEALKKAEGIPGIVPLLEHELPHDSTREPRWFVMPLAQRLGTWISAKKPVEIVAGFAGIADTLQRLHDLEIFHRDIKPANLLALDGMLHLSDFGLVKYPSRADITPPRGDVGPKFTMAPEMRREAGKAKGGPADVYSFAKTLWIALTRQQFGFDGQYLPGGTLGLSRFHPDIFGAPLDELLTECTDNDPAHRPEMEQVGDRLREWIALENNFHRRNLREWVVVQNLLFPHGAPSRATWMGVDEICAVLRLASLTPSLNHMFFPTGGGNTIDGVSIAGEPGLIRLEGTRTLIKPAKLAFESFGPGSRWNYFRLEAEAIEPTGTDGAYLSSDGYTEELCELTSGHYGPLAAWENNEYRGSALPPGAIPVARYLKGSFVIFSTRSPYNLDPSTYDGRHARMSEDRFREYIAEQARRAP